MKLTFGAIYKVEYLDLDSKYGGNRNAFVILPLFDAKKAMQEFEIAFPKCRVMTLTTVNHFSLDNILVHEDN